MRDDALRLYHQQTIEIWEQFCRLHHELYERTCDEYQALLSGEIESLEPLISEKESLMKEIGTWENRRAELIATLNQSGVSEAPVVSVTDLLNLMAEPEAKLAIPALRNLNALLIDVITRLQEQNRRNQQFLNRAMHSLNELKQSFRGPKNYVTYGADGATRPAGR